MWVGLMALKLEHIPEEKGVQKSDRGIMFGMRTYLNEWRGCSVVVI